MRIKNNNVAACNSCGSKTYGGNNNVDSSDVDKVICYKVDEENRGTAVAAKSKDVDSN